MTYGKMILGLATITLTRIPAIPLESWNTNVSLFQANKFCSSILGGLNPDCVFVGPLYYGLLIGGLGLLGWGLYESYQNSKNDE